VPLQAQNSDPLEQFCDDNPDADECRWVWAWTAATDNNSSIVSAAADQADMKPGLPLIVRAAISTWRYV